MEMIIYMSDFEDKVNKFFDTEDDTAMFYPDDIEQNKMTALFSYLSWLVIIPILTAPNSNYARFHANQGLILAIIEVVLGVFFSLMSFMPFVGWIFALMSIPVSLFCFGLSIFGIINAVNGKAKKLPLVGNIIILK